MGQLRNSLQCGIRSNQSIGSVCPRLGCYLCRIACCFQCFCSLFICIFCSPRCSGCSLSVLVGLQLHRMGIGDHLLHHGVYNRAGPYRVGVLNLANGRRIILRTFRDCVKLFCHELSPPSQNSSSNSKVKLTSSSFFLGYIVLIATTSPSLSTKAASLISSPTIASLGMVTA